MLLAVLPSLFFRLYLTDGVCRSDPRAFATGHTPPPLSPPLPPPFTPMPIRLCLRGLPPSVPDASITSALSSFGTLLPADSPRVDRIRDGLAYATLLPAGPTSVSEAVRALDGCRWGAGVLRLGVAAPDWTARLRAEWASAAAETAAATAAASAGGPDARSGGAEGPVGAPPPSGEPPPWGTCGVSEFRLKRRWRRRAPAGGGAVEPAYIERAFRYGTVERREADLSWATTTATAIPPGVEMRDARGGGGGQATAAAPERWDPLFQRPTRRPRLVAPPTEAVAAAAAWAPRPAAGGGGGVAGRGVEVFASDDESGSVAVAVGAAAVGTRGGGDGGTRVGAGAAGGAGRPPPPPARGGGAGALLSYSMDFFGGGVVADPPDPLPVAAGVARGDTGGGAQADKDDGRLAVVVEERGVEVFGSDDEDGDDGAAVGPGRDGVADAAAAAAGDVAAAAAADAAAAAAAAAATAEQGVEVFVSDGEEDVLAVAHPDGARNDCADSGAAEVGARGAAAAAQGSPSGGAGNYDNDELPTTARGGRGGRAGRPGGCTPPPAGDGEQALVAYSMEFFGGGA